MRLGFLLCLFALGASAAEPGRPLTLQLGSSEPAPQPAFRNPGLRKAGIWMTAGGGLLLVGSAVFALAGVHTNSWIQAGSDTVQDAIRQRDRGRAYNIAAWSMLAGGGLLIAAGVPMIIAGSRAAPQAALAVAPGGAVAVVRFP